MRKGELTDIALLAALVIFLMSIMVWDSVSDERRLRCLQSLHGLSLNAAELELLCKGVE